MAPIGSEYGRALEGFYRYVYEPWLGGPLNQSAITTPWSSPIEWNKDVPKGKKATLFCAGKTDFLSPLTDAAWRKDLLKVAAATPNLEWHFATDYPENLGSQLYEPALNGSFLVTRLGGNSPAERLFHLFHASISKRILIIDTGILNTTALLQQQTLSSICTKAYEQWHAIYIGNNAARAAKLNLKEAELVQLAHSFKFGAPRAKALAERGAIALLDAVVLVIHNPTRETLALDAPLRADCAHFSVPYYVTYAE
jgi:xanthine/CO dehydrogenase XdhC/CoxF family maturation factor